MTEDTKYYHLFLFHIAFNQKLKLLDYYFTLLKNLFQNHFGNYVNML
jgi:hypothetical protein